MRLVPIVTLSVVFVASVAGRTQQAAPFVAIAVWYPAGPSGRLPTLAEPGSPRSAAVRGRWVADLRAIKAAGFNSIRTAVHWAASERTRGEYRFEPLEEILGAAAETGLKAIVQVDTAASPGWLPRRYTDAAVVNAPGMRAAISTTGYCQDHPGVRADIAKFISAAATAAAAHESFYAIDVWRNPGVSSSTSARACYCAHTVARFRTALEQKYGSLAALNGAWGRRFPTWNAVDPPTASGRPAVQATAADDWRQFTARKLQQDLKFRADASAPRGARPVSSHGQGPMRGDAWLMASAVDHYGTSLQRTSIRSSVPPFGALTLLDLTRSAARDRSWWVGAVQTGGTDGRARTATGADLRLWSWAAISRGAGSISFDDWEALNGGAGLQGASTAVRAAGDFAGVVGRNSGLFSRVRPHSAKIAILRNGDGDVSGRTGAAGMAEADGRAGVYRALVDRNISVDFIHPDEVVAGVAGRYEVVYTAQAAIPSGPVSDGLKAFTNAGGTLLAATARQSQEVPRGIRAEVGIDPAGAQVEARFLESSDALVLVAMNYGTTPRKVTLTFAPDVPEAIWQNLETGAAVSFVQSAAGPTYTRAFAARDVLVLVRGKRLR